MAFVAGVCGGSSRSEVGFFGRRGQTVGRRSRVSTARWSMASILIVNAPSGGHAFVGYHLADQLQAKGHKVALFTAGSEDSASKKEPCKSYPELAAKGVKIGWGDPTAPDVKSQLANVFGDEFGVVVENYSKSGAEVGAMVDYAKGANVGQFLYVSSCGIYKKNDEVPLQAGDPVNEKAGQVEVEKMLASSGLNYSSFRPIYIVGPKAAKSEYLDYFFHRIVRDRPVLLPGSGDQMTSITHVGDVASMLVSAVGNSNATGEIFNVVSPRFVSHTGVANLCAKIVGKEPKIVKFDPSKLDVELKKFFPFRNQHFFADPSKAAMKLGWQSTYALEDAIYEGYQMFKASGKGEAFMDFSTDDQLVAAM